ncbi:MAG: 50S ribosome-binding GTPase [Lachnospiraceae bacterium]|nr:50S ribosome-binding GTPase [Lachnospiraceae bacterium]
MEENDLKKVLNECKKTAKVGYKIASTKEKKLNRVLYSAQEKVQSTTIDFNSSPCYAPEATELLESQLADIRSAFNRLSFTFKEDLQNLHENLSIFSITLFGRTMAGKSTLMEILTEGDGTSIGKGSQRTTKDVRKYTWNGMEITDVPGIGAFEGEEDEQLAFEAAKMADLILFLITDDAPQVAEAECFSKIVNLGKPIICIMNVKVAISADKSIKLAIRDINKRFDMERLSKIRNQFLLFSEQYGQTWSHLPFVYVHLMSAYLAQCTEDKERSKEFYTISRVENLKKMIVEQVRTKGEFYRIKTFIDIISNPILESMERLLEQSQVNSVQGRTILTKKRQFDDWKNHFYRDGKSQIKSLIVNIKSELNGEIASFAENHFDDKNADKAWNALLKSKKVEVRCQELLEDLEMKCNDKLKEISREITNELKFSTSFAGDKSLKMKKIIDAKKLWDWSSIAINGGLSIAAGIAYLVGAAAAGPLGWAALAVSVLRIGGSLLFKSRDEKEYEARTKLEKKLRDNVSRICDTLQTQMAKNLDSLVSAKIERLLKEMDRINSVIFRLADTQRELAWGLNDHLMELNKQILEEAIKLIGADGLQYHVLSVARIPGNISMIKLNDGTVFPKEQVDGLYNLMSERIHFVYDTDNMKILISRVIGKEIDRSHINIEEKIGVAHVPLENATPNTQNRVRLAQQFSGLLIMQ